MPPALELRNLRKTFGTTVAVEGMDLVVPGGALYGVIGPNGAGKTTCLRMIMSILFQDSGELSVLGRRSALEAKDRIGYWSCRPSLPSWWPYSRGYSIRDRRLFVAKS